MVICPGLQPTVGERHKVVMGLAPMSLVPRLDGKTPFPSVSSGDAASSPITAVTVAAAACGRRTWGSSGTPRACLLRALMRNGKHVLSCSQVLARMYTRARVIHSCRHVVV